MRIKKEILLTVACLGGALFSASGATAQPSDFQMISQGDGDPSERAAGLLADERLATPEESVATVTADGEFLLPTYLVAADAPTAPPQAAPAIASAAKPVPAPAPVIAPLPLPAPAIQPAPIVAPAPIAAPAPRAIGTGHAITRAAAPQRLLLPLAELPIAETEEPLEARAQHIVPSDYADRLLQSIRTGAAPPFIMPQELKVTFYPGSSAFSGQTLKWVKAFSAAALADPRLSVEIRLNPHEAALQQARLFLVKDALIGNGLSPHQIQVVFTNRPADTLLLITRGRAPAVEESSSVSAIGTSTVRRTTKW